MSPRVIQLPMSGRDRRHYVRELRSAEQAHARITVQLAELTRVADHHLRALRALACQEWNVRQFIGGDGAPSPSIAEAIHGGCELLEVRCKRCGHHSLVDLAQVIWPRQNQIHTLANVLRCQRCKDDRKRPAPDLVALRPRETPDPAAPAVAKRK